MYVSTLVVYLRTVALLVRPDSCGVEGKPPPNVNPTLAIIVASRIRLVCWGFAIEWGCRCLVYAHNRHKHKSVARQSGAKHRAITSPKTASHLDGGGNEESTTHLFAQFTQHTGLCFAPIVRYIHFQPQAYNRDYQAFMGIECRFSHSSVLLDGWKGRAEMMNSFKMGCNIGHKLCQLFFKIQTPNGLLVNTAFREKKNNNNMILIVKKWKTFIYSIYVAIHFVFELIQIKKS